MSKVTRKMPLKAVTLAAIFSSISSIGFATQADKPLPRALVSIPVEVDIGAAERVGAATRMRTLTQQIPAAACHLNGKINERESRALLKEAKRQFPKLQDALLNGSYDLRIKGGASRSQTIAGIAQTAAAWGPVDGAIETLLRVAQQPDAHKTIAIESEVFLEKAGHSLGLVTAENAHPADLLFADALLIDIAGRQSMLSQKLSLEFCKLWSGDQPAEAASQIKKTIQMFEANLAALRDGAPDIGLEPVATAKMRAILDDVQTDWDNILPAIEAVIAYGDASEGMKTVVFDGLNTEMYRLERLMKLCVLYAKHNYS